MNTHHSLMNTHDSMMNTYVPMMWTSQSVWIVTLLKTFKIIIRNFIFPKKVSICFPISKHIFVFSFLGTILNTGMHNVEGGYENDCSVARLAYNRYMLMSPSIQQMRSFTWVKHHLPEDGSVFLQVFSIEHVLLQ